MVWRRLLRDSRCDGKKAVVCGALCNLPDVLLLFVNESDWVKGRREKGRRGESGAEKRGGHRGGSRQKGGSRVADHSGCACPLLKRTVPIRTSLLT